MQRGGPWVPRLGHWWGHRWSSRGRGAAGRAGVARRPWPRDSASSRARRGRRRDSPRGASRRLTKLLGLLTLVDELLTVGILPPMASVPLKSPAEGELVRAVVDVTANLPAQGAPEPQRLRVLLELLADRELPTSDPLAKARLRGVLAMRELLSADGGAYTASEVAGLLSMTRQAVDKRRKAGQLLAIGLPKRGLLYPAWQFADAGETSRLRPRAEGAWQTRSVGAGAVLRHRQPSVEGQAAARRASSGRVPSTVVLLAASAFGQHGSA